MITGVIAFIHARKWLVELILAAVVVAGVYLFCQHLIHVGVQRQRDEDVAALAVLRKEDQAKADKAEHSHDQEISDLRDFRDKHPFSYRVCIQSSLQKPHPADDSNDGASASATMGERMPQTATDITEDRGPLLEAFAALFDEKNSTLRQWQTR